MKLNQSKTKELVIRGRSTLPPLEPIVTIKRVSYLKLLGVTFQDNPTNWDKHFDDLMERALKRMHWSLECVKEMVIVYLILITTLFASLCHFLLAVSEFGVLLLIPNITLVKLIGYWEGPFDLGIFNTYDITAAILMSQNNETENMLVFQINPLGVELFSYVKAFFCSHKFA